MYSYSEIKCFKQTSETVNANVRSGRSSLIEFQAVGPATANAQRHPYKLRLGTTRYWHLAEHRYRWLATSDIGMQ